MVQPPSYLQLLLRLPTSATTGRRWPGPAAWLALLALGLAAYHYFTGEATSLPVQLLPRLAPVTLVLDSVAVGPAHLPLPVYGYLTTLTHDVGGPYTRPDAATLWLLVLGLGVAGWLAVASTLRRTAFVAATVPLVLLLTSLNADGLGLFGTSGRQTFLTLALAGLGAAALALQLWGEGVRLLWRVLLFGALVAGLAWLLAARSTLPLPETALYLAANATPAGAVLLAALLLWVGLENVRALLWFNTQAERPEGRFGLVPFLLSSGLYLGALGLYYFNDRQLDLGWGLHLDPLVLLLPAVLSGWLGLRQRVAALPDWLPLPAARPLYGLLVALAAGALGYALATANSPLLDAARDATVLALGLLGAAFLLYVLLNFGPLIRQRLQVYRVAFAPRRLPLYAVYVLALGTVVVLEVRTGWPLLDQVAAGTSNQLGDLARQQSEARPDDLPLALLAESYYARSGDELDRFNRSAQLGRAALYRFREQNQNEQNALRRALLRQPNDPKVSLRLAAQLTEPADFLAALDVLRQAHRADPRNFAITSDLAQLFTRSSLTDSVLFYLNQSAQLAPRAYVGRSNELALALGQQQYAAARPLAAAPAGLAEPALAANQELLQLLAPVRPAPALPTPDSATRPLAPADFAQLYHQTLLTVRAAHQPALAQLLPVLATLAARPENGTYYEQLLFLQALARHAAGHELAARQALAPLAAGSSASAGYYQYVLGLWQLQQQQYGTAAAQLGLAASHRAAAAPLAQAWALAYAGQPDSARAQVRRLAASPDADMRRRAAQLTSLLAAGPLPAPAAAAPLAGATLAARARAAEAKQPALAARLYEQVLAEAPFNEPAVLAAGAFYTAQQQPGNAYEALRRGLVENPDAAPLLQAYALAAASDGVAELGESALAQLRPRLSVAAYATLLEQFQARRAAHAAAAAEFGVQ